MSTFFRALEQAERERALREAGAPASAPALAPVPDPTLRPDDGTTPRGLAEGAVQAMPAPAPAPVAEPSTRPEDGPEPHRAVEVAAPVPRRRRAGPDLPVGTGLWVTDLEDHLVSLLRPASLEAERYRVLRHLVEQRRPASGGSLLAISSPVVGDGKTTTAINLAGALGQDTGARVLLIDADLRRPSVGLHLGLAGGGPGLVEAILDPAIRLADVAQPRPPFNLTVVTAGSPPPAPYEILKAPRLGELLAQARQEYDYVVLDTAPLVPTPDTQLVARWMDGLVLVVAAHKTPRRAFEEAVGLIDPAKPVWLVFNEDDASLTQYYYRARPMRAASNGRRLGWLSWWPGRRRRSEAWR